MKKYNGFVPLPAPNPASRPSPPSPAGGEPAPGEKVVANHEHHGWKPEDSLEAAAIRSRP